MTKRKRWSSLDQRAGARYAGHRPSTGTSITGIPDAWEGLLGRKWVGQTMRFTFTPTAMSEWSGTVRVRTSSGIWSPPRTIQQKSRCVCGMGGSA